jgi:hypothetical protein
MVQPSPLRVLLGDLGNAERYSWRARYHLACAVAVAC